MLKHIFAVHRPSNFYVKLSLKGLTKKLPMTKQGKISAELLEFNLKIQFSMNWPNWADSVIELPCPSVEMCVASLSGVFFQASHFIGATIRFCREYNQ